MPTHQLTHVDREQRTAICSVCGPIPIYVANDRQHPHCMARAYCINRIRESTEARSRHLSEQKRLMNPNQQPRPSLSQIDPEKMTAVCAVCGSIDIRKKGAFYICAEKKREDLRKYRRCHYIPRPRKPRQSGHSLSQIDDKNKTAVCRQCGRVRIYVSHVRGKIIRRCNKASIEYTRKTQKNNQRFIEEYKVRQGCQRCGYNTSPAALELHRRNLAEKDVKTSKLIMFGRERLPQEFEKCDVLCLNCHYLAHSEFALLTGA